MASAGIGHSLEGIHAVSAALAAGRVRRLIVEHGRAERGAVADLVATAKRSAISVTMVNDVREHASTYAPQGVIAECTPVPTYSIDELAGHERPAIVVVDHVEDPQNVGAIARSAAAAGMTGMVVADVRAAPLEATAFKASVGALERLPVSLVASIPQALKRLRDKHLWTVGLAADGNQTLFGLALLTEPVAIVVGSEASGISELARKRCDVTTSIPMESNTESLNASVAAALACFEVLRMRESGL